MSGRYRRTRAEIERFDADVRKIARRVQPATARQVYYRAVVAQIVTKDDRGYRWVCESLSRQRWAGDVPWSWISDETRATRAPDAWRDADSGVAAFAETYRRDAWRDQPSWVEVWCESDSLAGTLVAVTWNLGVPLYSGRGFSSLTALRGAATQILGRHNERRQPTRVLYVGDLDPAGWAASRAAREGLHRHLEELGAPESLTDAYELDSEMFCRLAVNPSDVELYELPQGGAPKGRGPGSSAWWQDGGPGLEFTVEAEAFEPELLRLIVRDAILRDADVDALKRVWEAEAVERESLRRVAASGLFSELAGYDGDGGLS